MIINPNHPKFRKSELWSKNISIMSSIRNFFTNHINNIFEALNTGLLITTFTAQHHQQFHEIILFLEPLASVVFGMELNNNQNLDLTRTRQEITYTLAREMTELAHTLSNFSQVIPNYWNVETQTICEGVVIRLEEVVNLLDIAAQDVNGLWNFPLVEPLPAVPNLVPQPLPNNSQYSR